MRTNLRCRRSAPAQEGFGLVEIMVGVVIGMIAVLVIFQVYNVAEGFKRNTTAYGEAEQAGLFSTFVMGMELGNAGAGLNTAATDLEWCAPALGPLSAPFTGNLTDMAITFRPIPVLICDGNSAACGGNGNFDSFVVGYSVASTLSTDAPFTAAAGLNQAYQIQSPGGFHAGDLIVGIVSIGGPTTCASSTATAVSAPNGLGVVTITQTGTAQNFTTSSWLFNMGPCNRAQKVQYNVGNLQTVGTSPQFTVGVLQSTPLLNGSTANLANCGQPIPVAQLVANPLASNVVVMKAEYGINTSCSKERELDTWVQATAGGGWDPATLLTAPINCIFNLPTASINQIKAVRIGIIVQSEQFDKTLGDYNWVLFDCTNANKATCPGRLTGTVAAQANPAGNWRFRKYETIIPLRNVIWNPT